MSMSVIEHRYPLEGKKSELLGTERGAPLYSVVSSANTQPVAFTLQATYYV